MSSTTISAINNFANVIVGFCRGIFLHQPRVDLVRRLLQDGRLSSCMTIFFVCMRCLFDVFVLVKKKKIDGEGKLRKSIKENYQILAYFGKSMLYWCESFLQLALSMFSTFHNREIDYSSFSVLFLTSWATCMYLLSYLRTACAYSCRLTCRLSPKSITGQKII